MQCNIPQTCNVRVGNTCLVRSNYKDRLIDDDMRAWAAQVIISYSCNCIEAELSVALEMAPCVVCPIIHDLMEHTPALPTIIAHVYISNTCPLSSRLELNEAPN